MRFDSKAALDLDLGRAAAEVKYGDVGPGSMSTAPDLWPTSG